MTYGLKYGVELEVSVGVVELFIVMNANADWCPGQIWQTISLSSQGGQCASGSWSFFLTWLWNWEIWRIILNQSMQKLSVHVICVNVKLPHREFWRLIMNQSMKMSSIIYILTTPGKTEPTFTFILISLTVLSCLEENVNKPGLVSQPTTLHWISSWEIQVSL